MYKQLLLCTLVFMIVAQDIEYESTYLYGLRTSEFGKTVLEAIQLKLSSNSSIDQILEMLKQMKDDINSEQDVERQKSRDHTKFCDDKYDEILFVIDVAANHLSKDQTALPIYLEEQRDKQRQLLDKQELEQRNLQRLQQLADERQITRTEYEQRREELTTLIGALQEGRRLITQMSTKKYDPLAGTYSFMELAQPMFNLLEKHQYKFQKTHQLRGYGAMYSLLLETAQDPGVQADQKGVSKIQEIIDELVDSVYDVMKKELIVDNNREQDYQNQKERIELQNRRLEGTIAKFKARVAIINQTILELQNDIKANSDKSFLMNKQKDDWEKTCVDYHNGYVEATKIRTEESDILTEVIQILQRHYDDLASFVQMLR